MNREMMKRMKIAGEYQKKAIRALFPEEMEEHFDVIEKEMKEMFMEMAMAAFMDMKESTAEPDEEREDKKTRKVDIG